MKLDLRFTARPLEEVWCQVAVALVFEGTDDKGDAASGLDVKTSGYLTYLRERGFLTGADGETILLASQNMIRAEKIFLKGLGAREEFTLGLLSKRIEEIGAALDKIEACDVGIRIPLVELREVAYATLLETACMNLLNPYLIQHKEDPDFLLKIVFSVGTGRMGELESALRPLRESFSSSLDTTIVFDSESDF
jgi:hypothetical protein